MKALKRIFTRKKKTVDQYIKDQQKLINSIENI